jgi:hypothetical protein
VLTSASARQVLGGRGIPYTYACDVWSLGVVAYVCLCGYTPFFTLGSQLHGGTMAPDMRAQIMEGRFDFPPAQWDAISPEAKDLISKCLVVAPADRITAAQMLEHPWITGAAATSEVAQAPVPVPAPVPAPAPAPLAAARDEDRLIAASVVGSVVTAAVLASAAAPLSEEDSRKPATPTQRPPSAPVAVATPPLPRRVASSSPAEEMELTVHVPSVAGAGSNGAAKPGCSTLLTVRARQSWTMRVLLQRVREILPNLAAISFQAVFQGRYWVENQPLKDLAPFLSQHVYLAPVAPGPASSPAPEPPQRRSQTGLRQPSEIGTSVAALPPAITQLVPLSRSRSMLLRRRQGGQPMVLAEPLS